MWSNVEKAICSRMVPCAVTTGRRTGRSPKDRFIVLDDITRSMVDWGTINQPFEPEAMDALWARVNKFR